MKKIRYPNCPYCGDKYIDEMGEYQLMRLAIEGWTTEQTVKCHGCGRDFKVTVKIMYYGSKK